MAEPADHAEIAAAAMARAAASTPAATATDDARPLRWTEQCVLGVLNLAALAVMGCYAWSLWAVDGQIVDLDRRRPAAPFALPQPGSEDANGSPARPPTGLELRVNINTAGWAELALLPGIGETLAKRIITYRANHGPFTTVDQLREVNGIGEKKLEALRGFVVLDEPAS